MSVRKRIGELFGRAFPLQPVSPSPLEQFRADVAAKETAARAAKIDHARRLSPFVGELVLVTGFGFDMTGQLHETFASRIAAAISKTLPRKTAFGISVHLDTACGSESLTAQQQSAYKLMELLKETHTKHIPTFNVAITEHRGWLGTIVDEAEATLMQDDPAPGTTEHTFGHIAVVHPLNVKDIGVTPMPYPAEAVLLQGVNPREPVPEYSWQTISLNNPAL